MQMDAGSRPCESESRPGASSVLMMSTRAAGGEQDARHAVDEATRAGAGALRARQEHVVDESARAAGVSMEDAEREASVARRTTCRAAELLREAEAAVQESEERLAAAKRRHI